MRESALQHDEPEPVTTVLQQEAEPDRCSSTQVRRRDVWAAATALREAPSSKPLQSDGAWLGKRAHMARKLSRRMPMSGAHGTGTWCAVAVASLLLAPRVLGQPPQATPAPATSASQPAAARPAHPQPDRFAGRAGTYYRLIWGVDSLSVKWTESGEVIRFSYRVLDPEKAAPLNEKRFEPSLIDPKAGVQLVVPSMEKIGQLRQSSTPEAGKSYWMAFSNKGRLVKRGDHVNVVIGTFRADGLVVD